MSGNLVDNLKDVAAEEALLGALLIDAGLLEEITLDGSEFYNAANKTIFKAMRKLAESGSRVDMVTLQSELGVMGELENVGGDKKLIQLVNSCPTAYNAIYYADIIREKHARRRALQNLSKVANAAVDPDADFGSAVASVFDQILKDSGGKTGAEPLGKVLGNLFDDVSDAIQKPRKYFGIPTGFAGYDKITSGLQHGELMMLSGEPGVGKSSFAMQLVIGASRGVSEDYPGVPGAVYQLEMTALATARRAVAYEAKVEAKKLRSGMLDQSEIDRFTRAMGKFEQLPILISDRTDWTTFALRADVAKLKAQYGIGWVLIDYMALLKDDPGMDANERSAVISDRVHAIAKDYDVAVLAVHDMTKAGMTGQTSGQASLAGSRRVIYNADTIAVMTKTDTDGVLQLAWTKYREDESNRVLHLSRAKNFAHFAETQYRGGVA